MLYLTYLTIGYSVIIRGWRSARDDHRLRRLNLKNFQLKTSRLKKYTDEVANTREKLLLLEQDCKLSIGNPVLKMTFTFVQHSKKWCYFRIFRIYHRQTLNQMTLSTKRTHQMQTDFNPDRYPSLWFSRPIRCQAYGTVILAETKFSTLAYMTSITKSSVI